MRTLVASLLFFLASYVAVVSDTTPPPPSIAVQAPTEESIKAEIRYEKKLKQVKIATDMALVVFRRHNECRPFAELVGVSAVEEHVPARVFAAMAIAESSCNATIVSPTGDVGVWQVNAKIHKLPVPALKNAKFNAKFAAHYLRQCINKAGNIEEALHRYNGLDKPEGAYSSRILSIAYGRAT